MTDSDYSSTDRRKRGATLLYNTQISCCPFCHKFDRDGSFVLMPEENEMAGGMWVCVPDARKNGGL